MNEKTIFMNISSDNVIISDWKDISISLSRNNLENILWEELVKLERKIWFKNVIVLNGPGGFTNLRVWTLCLNLLNTVLKDSINYYDFSKIQLYKTFYSKWFLPRFWVIYIWQKRNIRLRDFEENQKIWQYSLVDALNTEYLEDWNNVFLDEVSDENYYSEYYNGFDKISVLFEDDKIKINWNSINLDELDLISTKSVQANYMMDPSITLK